MVKIISCECNSKIGVLHLLQGKENEDAVTARCNGTLGVIAVCDGAGAMKAGGEAAKIVSEVIADTLFADFSDL